MTQDILEDISNPLGGEKIKEHCITIIIIN